VNGVAQAQTGSFEDLIVAGGGSLVVLVNSGALVVSGGSTSATSAVSVAGAGKVLLRAVAGTLTVNAGISSGNGNISLLSAGSQTFGADGDVTTGVASSVAGSIDVSADAAAAQIVMDAGTVFQTDGGNIRLITRETGTDGGGITLGVLDARIAADRTSTPTLTGQASGWGSVAVVSNGSSIVDTVQTRSTTCLRARFG